MRHGSSNRRRRHKNNSSRRSSAPSKSKVYDSNGPDVRIRGTAFQVTEKYAALAKDAASAGDIVLAENYLQYAEHYQRIINSWNLSENTSAKDTVSSDVKKPEENAQKGGADLSLPASILGSSSNEESKEQQPEQV